MKKHLTVMVTGAAGYVGSFLSRHLIKQGHTIKLIDNYYKPSNIREIENVPIYREDIRDPIDLKGYDLLVHCAAISGIGECENNKTEAFETNIRGVYNLLKSFKGKVIFPSTSAVYGICQSPEIDETHPLVPASYYGTTKLEAESIVKLHGNYVILRFSNIYGTGIFCKRTVTDCFIDNALKDLPMEINGDGKQCRDFVHINDVLRAYMLAIRSEINGTYNIGGNEALSVNQIAELVNKQYQKLTKLRLDVNHKPLETGVKWKDFLYLSKKAKDFLRYEPLYSVSDEIAERFIASK